MASSKPNLNFKLKRPSKKAVIIAVAAVLLLVVAGSGGYYVWRTYYAPLNNGSEEETVDEERQKYLKQTQNLKPHDGASVEDKIATLSLRASSSFELEDYQAAVDSYNEILALPGQANNDEALFGLARTYEAMEDKVKAKEYYRKIMQAYLGQGGSEKDEAYKALEKKVEEL